MAIQSKKLITPFFPSLTLILKRLYANYGFVFHSHGFIHPFFSLFLTRSLHRIVCVCVWAKIPHETGCELFEIIQCEGYNENRFRNDLKLLFTQIGVRNQRTVVLFSIINDQVSQPNCIYFVGSRKKNNHEEARHYIARHFCWCCCCCIAMRWNFENVRTIR